MVGPTRRSVVRGALLGAALATPALIGARAQAGNTIRIGVLTELNGPNSDATGHGSTVAARMAVEDFTKANPGLSVEVLEADHQTKPDIGAAIARRWIDEDGVDAITGLNNSAVALAVIGLVRERNRIALLTGPASSDLTGKACSPNDVHWVYDTWALGNSTGRALVAEGGSSWFFVAADYTFGRILEHDTAQAVTAAGGKILGTVYTPFPDTTDFSSFLLRAQASGAKVVGLANSGANTINCVKQAAEFDLRKGGTRLAALLMMITDVHALGLPIAQGLSLSTAFYWDMNDGTRAFSHRFAQRMGGHMPTMVQAGDYSAVTHYLKAVMAVGVEVAQRDGLAVMAAMKRMPTEDLLFGRGEIRPDGRRIAPMYLFEVKTPAQSRYPWDYYTLKNTIPADKAFRPMSEGGCPLVKS